MTMKLAKAGFILVISGLALIRVVAQEAAPPPPRPIIYAAPLSADIKEYVFDECGYAISFSGTPKIGTFPGACGSVYLYRMGSEVEVRRLGFSAKDFQEHPKQEILQELRDSQLINGKRLLDERDVNTAGFEGKEFRIGNDVTYARVRAFFIRDYLFVIYVDVKNWRLLTNSYPDIATGFEKEADRLFDSFRSLKQK